MNKTQNVRRARGRGSKRSKGNASSGRNDRVKGNPKQLLEKYKSLGRDALQSGDRILAEYYFQHADHYQRALNERNGVYAGVYRDEDQSESAEDDRPRRSRPHPRAEDSASEDAGAVDAGDPRKRRRGAASDPRVNGSGEQGEASDRSEGDSAPKPGRRPRDTAAETDGEAREAGETTSPQ